MRWLLIVLAACSRPLPKLDPPTPVPAFLGDASGFYVARHDAGIFPPRLVAIVQVEQHILITIGTIDAYDQALSFFGDLNDSGFVSQRSDADLGRVLPELARTFPALASQTVTVNGNVQLGFDAFTLTTSIEDGPGLKAVCAAYTAIGLSNLCPSLTAPVVFRGDKICDFDSRLAGVYRATLTSPQCGSIERDLAVVVANAVPVGALLSFDKDKMEAATLLNFDPTSTSLKSATVLPGLSTLSLAGTLAVAEGSTTLQGTATTDKCTFDVQASRVTGEKTGLLCTRHDFCQEVQTSVCPIAPGAVGAYTFEGYTNAPGIPCPVPICKLTLARAQACQPTQLACPVGQTVTLLPGPNCYNTLCSANPTCAPYAALSAVVQESCNPLAFVVRSAFGCEFTACP